MYSRGRKNSTQGMYLNEAARTLICDRVQLCEGYKIVESLDIEDTLRTETNGFTRESGGLNTEDIDKKNQAVQILKENGYDVEVSDGRMSSDETMTWHIEFFK